MVAAKGDDAREGFALFRRTDSVRICGGRAHEESVVAFFNLLDGIGVIVAD